MARVRFLGSEPVTVPELDSREIQPDQVVTVPDERFGGYVCQTASWESVEEPHDWVWPKAEDEGEAPADAAPDPEPEPKVTAVKKTAAAKSATTSKEG